jgi:hypothetical protein
MWLVSSLADPSFITISVDEHSGEHLISERNTSEEKCIGI